ncbi:MAG: hypothetical protein IPK82_20890 [Polyangiaceae bacterium]|nr:hypothetical protein [Polyangiaceae bacterium]
MTKLRNLWRPVGLCTLTVLLMGADGDGCSSTPIAVDPGTTIRMDMANTADFYASPFPSEHRRTADGKVVFEGFPNKGGVSLVDQISEIVKRDADGFGTSSGVYFTVTDEIDPASLPSDMRKSLENEASVFLVGVDPKAPDFGVRYPITVGFELDGGPFGAPNLLSLLPYQGVPLRPGTLYAAVVRRTVKDKSGKPLGESSVLRDIWQGALPNGMTDAAATDYRTAIGAVQGQGVALSDLAALAVFRTGNPVEQMGKFVAHALSQPIPEPLAPFEAQEVFDNFCVFHSTVKMPTYQAGDPPYDTVGGGWGVDESGNPAVQAYEEANFVITLPRAPMPEKGFPIVVFSRTGAGGNRPLVDRGVRAENGGEAIEPGTGPAMEFAKVGFAGSSIDGPHGGLRNPKNKDEQFLMFNVFNPLALRDNVRQSALEIALQAHILENVEIDASSCPGLTTPNGQPAHFDMDTMAAFGHSMGASIVPLALAYEPRLKAAILSGAGSSYIANIIHKKKPIETKGFAELILEYQGTRELTELDPVMTLLQWAAEPADIQAYGRQILSEADSQHHILMIEGVVDNYILPPIANSTALSLGLDLAGPELDKTNPQLASFAPLGSVLDLANRKVIPFPASKNVLREGGSTSTAVVVQHPEDGIEDGHEAAFQQPQPKHQYRCFLKSFAQGTPVVPEGSADETATCE